MRLVHPLAALAGAAIVATVVTAVPAAAGTPAAGTPAAVDRPADRTPGYHRTGRLVVGYRAGASGADRAAALRSVGATVQRESRGLDAVLVRAPGRVGEAAERLREHRAVRFVEPEGTYRAFADTSGPERSEIGVPGALTADPTLTGSGVEGAVIDTAVDPANPDLTGRVVVGADYSEDDPIDPTDASCALAAGQYPCEHGTAVATALAAADDGTGMVGVAPDATVVSYNVFRSNGNASSFAVASAIVAAANRSLADPARKLRVVNLSLGGPFDSNVIRTAVAYARDAGIVVVVAAGNDGGERANFPAGDPFALSVGATQQSSPGVWTVASFSSRGDVDVLAPGVAVTVWSPTETQPPAVRTANGTSFAAPLVAGIAAILAQKGYVGDVARAAIVASAEAPNGGPYAAANGSGRADLLTAYQLASGSAPYTAVFIDRGGQVANSVGRRTVEALRVDPVTPSPTTYATFSASHGTFSGVVNAPVSGTLLRSTATYAAPAANLGTVNGTLTASGGAGGEDSTQVGLRFLDPANGPEGVPAASGEAATVELAYGARTAYVRSVGLHSGAALTYTYGYEPLSEFSELLVWGPTQSGSTKVADAADEPFYSDDYDGDTGTKSVGTTANPYGSNTGRYKIGWYLFGHEDDGTYYLKTTYPQPTVTVTAPAIVSAAGTGMPFPVSWAKQSPYAVKYDVEWTTRAKTGTTWVTKPYVRWLTQTTATSAVFGNANVPTAVKQGTTYYLRVRAVDDLGSASPWVIRTVVVPANDNTWSLKYAGTWTYAKSTARWLGDYHVAKGSGRSVSITSDTNQFQVVGDKCAACGQFRVYVDGVLKATVDTRASSTRVRQVLWRSSVLPGGIKAHTLKIVVLGTAGRPNVYLDAVGLLR